VKAWVNINRIGILVEGIADFQTNSMKEIRGPKASIAYDLNNIPTPAAVGFAKAQGLELKDLKVKELDGEKFLFADKLTNGQALQEYLPKLVEKIFSGLFSGVTSWKDKFIFPQPLINFCAMLDEETLDYELDGVKASSKILKINGFDRKFITLDSALSYPNYMQTFSILQSIREKRKTIEARVNSLLPEGCMIRDPLAKIARYSLFCENHDPCLVRFEKKYLEMPEIVLIKVLQDYFNYIICEDKDGKIYSAAIALPISEKIGKDEPAIRSAMLDLELNKVWDVWNYDVHALPPRLEKITDDQQNLPGNELFCSCELMGIVEGLCELARIKPDGKRLNTLVALIEEGEKTEIGKILKGSGFSVVFNRLQGVEDFKDYAQSLKEVCMFFENRINTPSVAEARIISLAILLQGYVKGRGCFDFSPERLLNYLRCSSIKIDLFACLKKLFPGFRIDRRFWVEKAFTNQSRDNILNSVFENLISSFEFDPASLFIAIPDWKEMEKEEIESFCSLVKRIRGKLSDVDRKIASEPDKGLETELSNKLDELERAPGVDYSAIFNFYKDQKVDIEASLMNLPAILDDTESEYSSRITLLQRLLAQFSRLPFIRREKRNDKS
jgi:hypothetical protein